MRISDAIGEAFEVGGELELQEILVATKEVSIQRLSVVTSRSIADVIEAFEAEIGMPNLVPLQNEMSASNSFEEMRDIIQGAVGTSNLMVFLKLDMGDFLRKQNKSLEPVSIRYILGNPLIMVKMAAHSPDACSYAPVTVLIDQREDGVHLSYDTMSSALAPYGSDEALSVAKELDAKIELLLKVAAGADASV